MVEPIEEISEADADAHTRSVYADIKRKSGTPLINLIYRHLATMPVALDWAWGNISRDNGYGKLEQAASRLPRHRICATVPRSAWRLAGLSDDEVVAMSKLVQNYNKTNAINLIAVSCLLRALSATDEASIPVGGSRQANADEPAWKASSQTDDVQSVRQFLNRLVSGHTNVEPTMFRNFQQWPASLAITSAILAPLAATGALDAARAASVAAARQAADEMAGTSQLQPLDDLVVARRVAGSLKLFQQDVIGAMLPVGHALSDALGA